MTSPITPKDDELIETLNAIKAECSNDDCHVCDNVMAAASRIAELTEALTDIRNRILCPVGPSPTLDEIGAIASAALEKGRD